MFGRRRHAAAPAAPNPVAVAVSPVAVAVPAPLPRLAEEQIFELVHTRIAAAIGEGGEWVVRRRTPDDTDDIFRGVLAHQVAIDVTAALRSAQSQLEAGEPVTGSIAVASVRDSESEQSSEASQPLDSDATPAAISQAAVAQEVDVQAADAHSPSHRHDEPATDDQAELDEETVALQWEPAPITVWTDLKRPVTGPIALEHLGRDLVA